MLIGATYLDGFVMELCKIIDVIVMKLSKSELRFELLLQIDWQSVALPNFSYK